MLEHEQHAHHDGEEMARIEEHHEIDALMAVAVYGADIALSHKHLRGMDYRHRHDRQQGVRPIVGSIAYECPNEIGDETIKPHYAEHGGEVALHPVPSALVSSRPRLGYAWNEDVAQKHEEEGEISHSHQSDACDVGHAHYLLAPGGKFCAACIKQVECQAHGYVLSFV